MFRDRIVLITGGTSGIGLSLARAFVREHARVIVCGRDAGRLQAARDALPGISAISCDITHVDQVEAMIADIEARHRRLDILVNNAGQLVERDFTQAPLAPAALAAEIEANLIAPIVDEPRVTAPQKGPRSRYRRSRLRLWLDAIGTGARLFGGQSGFARVREGAAHATCTARRADRKSTRLNSSHSQ